jgi:hypothetical protein
MAKDQRRILERMEAQRRVSERRQLNLLFWCAVIAVGLSYGIIHFNRKAKVLVMDVNTDVEQFVTLVENMENLDALTHDPNPEPGYELQPKTILENEAEIEKMKEAIKKEIADNQFVVDYLTHKKRAKYFYYSALGVGALCLLIVLYISRKRKMFDQRQLKYMK